VTSMSAQQWDARYRDSGLVWGAKPNRWVEQEVVALPPGRALDLACGEGRNSLWLAQRGWQVTGVDFSAEAIGKARALEQTLPEHTTPVDWQCADATTIDLPAGFDLALLVYLQVSAAERRAALATAWHCLGPLRDARRHRPRLGQPCPGCRRPAGSGRALHRRRHHGRPGRNRPSGRSSGGRAG